MKLTRKNEIALEGRIRQELLTDDVFQCAMDRIEAGRFPGWRYDAEERRIEYVGAQMIRLNTMETPRP